MQSTFQYNQPCICVPYTWLSNIAIHYVLRHLLHVTSSPFVKFVAWAEPVHHMYQCWNITSDNFKDLNDRHDGYRQIIRTNLCQIYRK